MKEWSKVHYAPYSNFLSTVEPAFTMSFSVSKILPIYENNTNYCQGYLFQDGCTSRSLNLRCVDLTLFFKQVLVVEGFESAKWSPSKQLILIILFQTLQLIYHAYSSVITLLEYMLIVFIYLCRNMTLRWRLRNVAEKSTVRLNYPINWSQKNRTTSLQTLTPRERKHVSYVVPRPAKGRSVKLSLLNIFCIIRA